MPLDRGHFAEARNALTARCGAIIGYKGIVPIYCPNNRKLGSVFCEAHQ